MKLLHTIPTAGQSEFPRGNSTENRRPTSCGASSRGCYVCRAPSGIQVSTWKGRESQHRAPNARGPFPRKSPVGFHVETVPLVPSISWLRPRSAEEFPRGNRTRVEHENGGRANKTRDSAGEESRDSRELPRPRLSRVSTWKPRHEARHRRKKDRSMAGLHESGLSCAHVGV